jgi:hypothetical protein
MLAETGLGALIAAKLISERSLRGELGRTFS